MADQIFVILNPVWSFIKDWGWLILPFILIEPFLLLYLYWRQEVWFNKLNFIVLELRPAKELLKPIKAMETVFNELWHFYDPPNPREKWFEGKYQLSFALEIVSIDGQPHFYIRIPENLRNLVESSFYAQYPDLEIIEVPDYSKNVPQDIPNKDWEMWGCDYEMLKEDVYPIKTYAQFFEEKPDVAKEEKRIDPVSNLLEGMAKFKPGEQLWVQIIAKPVSAGKESDYETRGKKEVDKLVKRPKPPESKPIVEDAIDILVTGEVPKEKEKKEEIIPPEMKLTPGEREVVAAIENKISKYAFQCSIRFIQMGKRDVFFGANKAIPMGFFDVFSTVNVNGLKPMKATITKVHTIWLWFLDLRRVYVRKRTLFRNYIKRLTPFYPFSAGSGGFILNIEELASLFHFPGTGVTAAPAVSRIEAKKAEAPPNLPTE